MENNSKNCLPTSFPKTRHQTDSPETYLPPVSVPIKIPEVEKYAASISPISSQVPAITERLRKKKLHDDVKDNHEIGCPMEIQLLSGYLEESAKTKQRLSQDELLKKVTRVERFLKDMLKGRRSDMGTEQKSEDFSIDGV